MLAKITVYEGAFDVRNILLVVRESRGRQTQNLEPAAKISLEEETLMFKESVII